jgi:hypothetical protein
MNIKNLNQQELEQLQMLLNKMNPQPTEHVWVNPVDKMIDDIIKNFDFDKVQSVMEFLDWQWAGEGVPTIKSLKETAKRLLKGAVEARLGPYKNEHWEQPIIHGTGGFEARAWCNKEKTKIEVLDLKFILADWDAEIED